MTGRALRRNPLSRRRSATASAAGIVLLALLLPAAGAPLGQPAGAQLAQAAGRPAPPAAAAPATTAPVDVSGLIHVCSSCHGFDGRNNSSSFPNLAGQQKEFLVTELKAMRDHKRADPHVQTYMWGMTAQLTNPRIEAIAEYYSRQKPAAGTPSSSPLVAAGRKIYDEGIAAKGVPPCQACHGAQAQGNGAFPRLAGQHSEYVVRELGEFASGARASTVMHQNAKNLTPQEIDALAAYVSTL
jgi:cytochrome c553